MSDSPRTKIRAGHYRLWDDNYPVGACERETNRWWRWTTSFGQIGDAVSLAHADLECRRSWDRSMVEAPDVDLMAAYLMAEVAPAVIHDQAKTGAGRVALSQIIREAFEVPPFLAREAVREARRHVHDRRVSAAQT